LKLADRTGLFSPAGETTNSSAQGKRSCLASLTKPQGSTRAGSGDWVGEEGQLQNGGRKNAQLIGTGHRPEERDLVGYSEFRRRPAMAKQADAEGQILNRAHDFS
jgi:hypothetical protein